MADDDADQSSKTEDPSVKRLKDAHDKGDVAKSQELVTWVMLAGTAGVLALMGPSTCSALLYRLEIVFANADQYQVGGPALGAYFTALAESIIGVAIIPMVVLAVCAVAANLIQHRPLLSIEPITPKLSKISPLAGAKRLFSQESLVNFLKGIVKIVVVGVVMVFAFWPERDRLNTMVTLDPSMILPVAQELTLRVLWAALAIITAIALADFFYQKSRWWTRHKMTLQEVKDEFKQTEGDPKIKGRLRQLRMARARQRMMAAVPEATVIVTNPTHYAVALKYDRDMAAPLCVAKGADEIALRIRAVAKDNNVPIVENPPLARALYASVEIDRTIPTEHFKAVAQVIGYVMQLKVRSNWRA